jgi:uncharacterized membrane-anchored protein
MTNEKIVTTTKSPAASKVIWLNGIVFAISVVVWITESQTSGILPFEVEPEVLAMILTALNFALRFATTQPITTSVD